MAVVEIYRAHIHEDLKVVTGVLRRAGCEPVVMDDIDPVLAYRGFTRKIRIGVEAGEARRAAEAIAEWQKRAQPKVDEQSRIFLKQMGLSVLAGLVVTLIICSLSGELDLGLGAMVFMFSTFGTAALIGNLKK